MKDLKDLPIHTVEDLEFNENIPHDDPVIRLKDLSKLIKRYGKKGDY